MNTKYMKYFYAAIVILTLENSLCAMMGTAMARQNEAVRLTPQEAIAGLDRAKTVAAIMDKDEYRDPFGYSIHDNIFVNTIRNLPEFHGPSSDQKRLAEEFDQKMTRQNCVPKDDDEIYTYQQRQKAISCVATSIVISHKVSSTGRTVLSIAGTNPFNSAVVASASNGSANSGSHINSKRDVKFPSKEVLRESFRKANLAHFLEKSKIEDIADEEVYPLGVATKVELCLVDYNESVQKGVQNAQRAHIIEDGIQRDKSRILEILLQNDPAALKELKDRGIYNNDGSRNFGSSTSSNAAPAALTRAAAAIVSGVASVVTARLPIQRTHAASVPVGALPIAIPGVLLPIRGQDFFKESELDLVERELADRLKEERMREAREEEAKRRLKKVEEVAKEEERKKKEKTATTSLNRAAVAANATSCTSVARDTQALSLDLARRNAYAHLDQLKIASEHEARENESRQRAVINAAAALQTQIAHDATIKILQDAYTAHARNSSDRADFGDRGSSSSNDRDRDHGNPSSGSGVGGLSISSNGSVSAGRSSDRSSGSGICVSFDGHHYAGSHCSHGGNSGGNAYGGGDFMGHD